MQCYNQELWLACAMLNNVNEFSIWLTVLFSYLGYISYLFKWRSVKGGHRGRSEVYQGETNIYLQLL